MTATLAPVLTPFRTQRDLLTALLNDEVLIYNHRILYSIIDNEIKCFDLVHSSDWYRAVDMLFNPELFMVYADHNKWWHMNKSLEGKWCWVSNRDDGKKKHTVALVKEYFYGDESGVQRFIDSEARDWKYAYELSHQELVALHE